jgi:hypothetical protein
VGRPPAPRIWGWIQVGEVVAVDAVRDDPRFAWTRGHLHFAFDPDPSNTVYIAAEQLMLPGLPNLGLRGAGVFDVAQSRHRLTAGEELSVWRLPRAFLPDGRPPLTYHAEPKRWQIDGDDVLLRAAARGQEFVLNLEHYPDVLVWLAGVVAPE